MIPKVTDEELLPIIKECRGNMAAAGRRVGMTRFAVCVRVKANEELRKAVDDAKESFKDDAENVFYDKVLAGDIVALIFFLKTQCYDRGYGKHEDKSAASDSVERAKMLVELMDLKRALLNEQSGSAS